MHRRRGVTLVVVLAFLVLITAVAVGFFLSVSAQLTASKSYASGNNARQLADSAVEAVIGQLRLATASTDTSSNTYTWASQPGMIRSFDAKGKPAYSYKLYSSDNMIVVGAPTFASDFDPAWTTAPETMNKARYMDLNSPVLVPAPSPASNQIPVFPIIDPRAADTAAGNTYSLVDGFGYTTSASAGNSTISIPGAVAANAGDASSERLPMPVKWIYFLKDGTMTVPDGGSGNTATWSDKITAKPSAANPIVSRIAFWTDDETSKLNVNTACGAPYWDSPHFTTGMEMAYSRYKPVANEFARFPGHPATTSLLPVFWSFAGLASPNSNLVPTVKPVTGTYMTYKMDVMPTLTTLASNAVTSLLNFSPRNAPGGSQDGTVATTGYQPTSTQQFTPVALDGDRLYSTVDETLFAPPASSASANSTRVPNLVGTYSLVPSDVEKLRFFLTANSRAPELNPFNLPKISLWPVPQTTRTPTDNLIAFCSTLNSNPFYFTRGISLSATTDWTARNDQLFDYVIKLWGQPIPGFGGTLEARYSKDGDSRLLTLMYDYIRSTVNIFDTYGSSGATYNTATYPDAFMRETNVLNMGYGQVTPISITKSGVTYKGLGRFPGIKQVAIMFIAQAANQPPCVIGANGVPTNTINPMHPWTNNPTSVSFVKNADNTYSITAANAYPTIADSAHSNPNQTHAGLPFLSNKWVDPAAFNAAVADNPRTTADKTLLASVLNPRYQGPAFLYPGSTSPLPQPFAGGPAPGGGTLAPHTTQIQAIILVDPVDPAAGQIALSPALIVEITGLDAFQADGQSLGFGNDLIQTSAYKAGSGITGSYNLGMQTLSMLNRGTASPYSGSTLLSFVSKPVIVGTGSANFPTDGGGTFKFTGNNLVVKLWAPNGRVGGDIPTTTSGATLVQTINLKFPNSIFPTPLLPPMPAGLAAMTNSNRLLAPGNPQNVPPPSPPGVTANAPATVTDLCPSTLLTFDLSSPLSTNPNFGVGSTLYAPGCTHIYYNSNDTGAVNFILPERTTSAPSDYHSKLTCDTVRSIEVLYGDTRLSSSLPVVPATFYAPHKFYDNTAMRSAHTLRGGHGDDSLNFRGSTANFLSPAYVGGTSTYNTFDYDYYLHKTLDGRYLPANSPTQDILTLAAAPTSASISIPSSFPYVTSSTEFDDSIFGGVSSWASLTKFSNVWANGGDFETGYGEDPDGPTIGKMNEADASVYPSDYYYNPDFTTATGNDVKSYRMTQAFSPNRLMPSPVVLGSLPVPVDLTNPNSPDPTHSWRSLLFCPNPASYDETKTNAGQVRTAVQQVTEAGAVPDGTTAPDHLFLDFFEMPVVAPYAISEPFSTAGKVNMNYQIAPFTYITRTTALRGVLRDSVVTAVDDQWVGNYKSISPQYANSAQTSGQSDKYFNFLTNTGHWGFRYPVDVADTLKQFDQRFSQVNNGSLPPNNDLFRSPSEICSLWLYPATQPTATAGASGTGAENPNLPLPGVSWDSANSNIRKWWYDGPGTTAKSITGDNVRERPYATIYPRLTTQSNTYTVHFCVQVLLKLPVTPVAQWIDGSDRVQSEYRGSSVIERYIDPNDLSILDPATNPTVPLDGHYCYRVLTTKRFAP